MPTKAFLKQLGLKVEEEHTEKQGENSSELFSLCTRAIIVEGESGVVRPTGSNQCMPSSELEILPKESGPAVVVKIFDFGKTEEDPSLCPTCGGRRWWVSIYSVWVCAKCHPPASPDLVVRWEDEQVEH